MRPHTSAHRGSELLREVAWVIFDEVHYMKDRERGVVWEETIIFLEHEIKMVNIDWAWIAGRMQWAGTQFEVQGGGERGVGGDHCCVGA